MSNINFYSRIETVPGERVTATIYHSLSRKSARIEVWTADKRRRLDKRRCSPARAQERAQELIKFWSADQPNGDT